MAQLSKRYMFHVSLIAPISGRSTHPRLTSPGCWGFFIKKEVEMIARQWWYKTYRLLRIARRESLKAAQDMMIYGTGVVELSENNEAEHIPFDKIMLAKLA